MDYGEIGTVSPTHAPARVWYPSPMSMIDTRVAEFILGRRSIIAASRDADLRPSLMRACGLRIDATDGTLRVHLARSQAARLLADIATSRLIAVVVSEPSTHRTMQLKGNDARVEAATPEDLATLPGYAGQLDDELRSIGLPASFARAMIAVDPADVVAVRFTPTEIYDQTPGPRAGAAITS